MLMNKALCTCSVGRDPDIITAGSSSDAKQLVPYSVVAITPVANSSLRYMRCSLSPYQVAGVSSRSLTCAIQKRHGVGLTRYLRRMTTIRRRLTEVVASPPMTQVGEKSKVKPARQGQVSISQTVIGSCRYLDVTPGLSG